ncbi:UNVERIFIED_CONTAM: hypothetical protein Slati_1543400 [Sesamum latifolium]|uniref:RING-CH-type domain-containing protein n=1 Tax=Sesamum latifolium TaxID=2727402 RepID=A0AAW2X8P5_9LAMI
MEKERSNQTSAVGEEFCLPTANGEPRDDGSRHSIDREAGLPNCRVCQCVEPDRRGNIALGFLGISPPPCSLINGNEELKSNLKVALGNIENNSHCRSDLKESELVEFISPSGEVFVCTADVELGFDDNQDRLFELGCACKNDLALSHYACALKWFINHGSTVCEICGSVAKNIRSADFKKVVSEQPSTSNTVMEEVAPVENTATKWAVEGTGILLATGLLTVTLAWLLAPHVGKKTAKNGLHILLGGVCALTVVVFFRFFVLTRIKYGPARYWAILFVFWFLVFGIWASRTHGAHTT